MEALRINLKKYLNIRVLSWIVVGASCLILLSTGFLLYSKVIAYNQESVLLPVIAPTTISEAKLQSVTDLKDAKAALPDLTIGDSRF